MANGKNGNKRNGIPGDTSNIEAIRAANDEKAYGFGKSEAIGAAAKTEFLLAFQLMCANGSENVDSVERVTAQYVKGYNENKLPGTPEFDKGSAQTLGKNLKQLAQPEVSKAFPKGMGFIRDHIKSKGFSKEKEMGGKSVTNALPAIAAAVPTDVAGPVDVAWFEKVRKGWAEKAGLRAKAKAEKDKAAKKPENVKADAIAQMLEAANKLLRYKSIDAELRTILTQLLPVISPEEEEAEAA